MSRWLLVFIIVLLGLVLGLFYGWRIDPVQYTDITPNDLRIDFQTDYVLMVAEAYGTEGDPALAAQRLAVLGSEPPALIAADAYDYATQSVYPAEDLSLIQDLEVALQAWQPIPGTSLP